MYEGDSLFTLAPAGQAAVVGLSLAMAAALVVVLRRAARGRWPVRAALGLLALWLWLWLTPQLYYLLYQTLIPGLPWQIVVKWPPPGPLQLAEVLSFQGRATLAEHGRGVLGWVFLLVALARRRGA
ncbi:MAG: hypothetical protein AAGE18_08350 [Pseudomonadota bacterium]